MKRASIEALLWATAVVAAVTTWRTGVLPARAAPPETELRLTPPGEPLRFSGPRLAAAAAGVVRSDPFRTDRHPSAVLFSAGGEVTGIAMPGLPPVAPRPQLSLAGIVGPPWTALLEGLPGRDGAVVIRAGELVDGLRVREVTSNRVVIVGRDTTWHLTIKRNWQ
jgi:hypothetical protein